MIRNGAKQSISTSGGFGLLQMILESVSSHQTMVRNKSKRIISTSDGLGLLQMVSEQSSVTDST